MKSLLIGFRQQQRPRSPHLNQEARADGFHISDHTPNQRSIKLYRALVAAQRLRSAIVEVTCGLAYLVPDASRKAQLPTMVAAQTAGDAPADAAKSENPAGAKGAVHDLVHTSHSRDGHNR
jgi:hypothetical protein